MQTRRMRLKHLYLLLCVAGAVIPYLQFGPWVVAHGLHLRALEAVSRRLRDDAFVRALKQAKTREEIINLLERPEDQAL